MTQLSKANTFIGFVMRTGKFRIGYNASLSLKSANLIIVCKTISENSLKKAVSLSKKFHCPVIKTEKQTLEEITHVENAKVMSVCEKQLAKAILDNTGEDFITVGLEN